MVDLVQGPLIGVAFLIFALGLIFQGIQFFRLTAEKEWRYPSLTPETKKKKKTLDRLAELTASSPSREPSGRPIP